MLGLVHLVALINPLAEYINLVSKVIDTRSEIGLTDATKESADLFVLATKEKRGKFGKIVKVDVTYSLISMQLEWLQNGQSKTVTSFGGGFLTKTFLAFLFPMSLKLSDLLNLFIMICN